MCAMDTSTLPSHTTTCAEGFALQCFSLCYYFCSLFVYGPQKLLVFFMQPHMIATISYA